MYTVEVGTVEEIIVAVSKKFNIPEAVIRDQSNKARRVTQARHVAMYLACKLTYFSKQTIAEAFDAKNHTSVIYGFNRVSKELHNNQEMVDLLVALKTELERKP